MGSHPGTQNKTLKYKTAREGAPPELTRKPHCVFGDMRTATFLALGLSPNSPYLYLVKGACNYRCLQTLRPDGRTGGTTLALKSLALSLVPILDGSSAGFASLGT